MKEIINLRTIFNVLKNNEMLTFVGTLTDAINFNIENTQLREALHHCIKAVENTITKAVSTPEDKVEDLVKPTSAIEKNAWFTNDDLRSIQKINWAYYNALCNSDINKVKRDKLFRAARKCHIPEFDQEYDIKDVRLLIHQDNGYAPTVLHDAIISYDVNQKTITNVYDFIKNLKHEILNIVNYSQPLLQKAVTSTRYSLTPLDLALIKTKQNPDFIKICKLLLEKGARININSYEKIKWNKNPKEAQRRTQLAYAVSNNSVTVVSLLLDYVKIENINNEERRNLTDLVQQRIQKQNVDNVDEAKSIEKLLNKMFTDAPPASNLTSAGAAKTAQQQAPVKVVRATASSAAAEVPVTGERTPPGTQPSSITASSETIGQKEAGLSNCSQANLSTQESIQLPAPNKISVPQPPQVQEQKQSYNIERPKKARVIKVIERVIKLKQMEKVKFLNFQTGKFKINKIRGQKNKMIKAPLMIISQMCLLHQKINRIGLKVLP